MIDIDYLRQVFLDKLQKELSLDAAFTKAVWIAYQQGLKDCATDFEMHQKGLELASNT